MDDEQTRIIGMYLEDVRDGRRFLEIAKKAVAKKPVLIIKGGRTHEGARATASHTASMMVEETVFEGAMHQAGVLRMSGIDEFIRVLKGFLHMPIPQGRRLAFITYTGAQAIMSIDAAVEHGLQVAHLEDTTREKISMFIATPSKTQNPVDLIPADLVQNDPGDSHSLSNNTIQSIFEDNAGFVKHIRVNIGKEETLPSISSIYLCAALVENEMQDQFNIKVDGLAIDFQKRFIRGKESPDISLLKPIPYVLKPPVRLLVRCSQACPAGIDVPRYVRLVGIGNLSSRADFDGAT
jgi:hypothetical protein